MFAGLDFGRATKLLWLGDSLNTAKQLVVLGESSVGRFHRNKARGPAGGSEGPGGFLSPSEIHEAPGSHHRPPPTSVFSFLPLELRLTLTPSSHWGLLPLDPERNRETETGRPHQPHILSQGKARLCTGGQRGLTPSCRESHPCSLSPTPAI